MDKRGVYSKPCHRQFDEQRQASKIICSILQETQSASENAHQTFLTMIKTGNEFHLKFVAGFLIQRIKFSDAVTISPCVICNFSLISDIFSGSGLSVPTISRPNETYSKIRSFCSSMYVFIFKIKITLKINPVNFLLGFLCTQSHTR